MRHRRSTWRVAAWFLTTVVVLVPRAAQPAEPTAAAPHIVVAQDSSGDIAGRTGGAIQAAIDKAHAAGGGVVLVRAGTYTLERELDLSGKCNVAILGSPGTVLKAARQLVGTLAEDAPAGTRALAFTEARPFVPHAMLEIRHPGRTTVTPSGKKFTQPFIMSRVQRVEGATVYLASPLGFAATKGTKVTAVFNGIVVRGKASHLSLEGLTIDMNRSEWPLRPLNHTHHCALFASGPYSYEKGPTGPPVEGLRIIRCTFRNAHQRGIALYSVVHSGVYGCRIENTGAEGIDFDHFCTHCDAVDNTLDGCANIELNDASHCLVARNRIARCHVGIVVWQWCKLPGLNERNLILGNEITHARTDGIRLQAGADRNRIVGNTVRCVQRVGIQIDGIGNVATDNVVEDTGHHGIRLAGSGNVALRNRCTNYGRAKPGAYKAIAVAGTGNHAEENAEHRTAGGNESSPARR